MATSTEIMLMAFKTESEDTYPFVYVSEVSDSGTDYQKNAYFGV